MKERVLKFISLIRGKEENNFVGTTKLLTTKIFTEGECYTFFKILKFVFPNAEPYYVSNNYYNKNSNSNIIGHIITKIDDLFFDITGKVNINYKYIFPLSSTQAEKCESDFGFIKIPLITDKKNIKLCITIINKEDNKEIYRYD